MASLLARKSSQVNRDTVSASSPKVRKQEANQEAVVPDDPASSIPDGGFIAWLQCVSSFLLLMNCFGIVNSFGVFQTFYERTLLPNQSASQISWIGSIQAFLLIGLGIIVGPIYDYGYLRYLLYFGSFSVVLGMVLTGLCSKYWQLLLSQGILVGCGSGCLFLPSIAVLPQHFEKRRALATGIGSTGSAIGSIVYPILFNHLQPRIGFKWSAWIIALIMLVTLIVPVLAMRMRFRPLQVRRVFDPLAWREWPFCLWAGFLFSSLLGLYVPSFYIQLYGVEIMDEGLAFYLLPLLNAGSFFGRIIPLYLADKVGPLNIEIPCTLMASMLAFAWILIHNTTGILAFSPVYGFLAGAITTVTPLVDVALCPSLDLVGVRMGMLFLPWAGGLLIGTPIASTVLLAATALGIAVRVVKYGWYWKIKC